MPLCVWAAAVFLFFRFIHFVVRQRKPFFKIAVFRFIRCGAERYAQFPRLLMRCVEACKRIFKFAQISFVYRSPFDKIINSPPPNRAIKILSCFAAMPRRYKRSGICRNASNVLFRVYFPIRLRHKMHKPMRLSGGL